MITRSASVSLQTLRVLLAPILLMLSVSVGAAADPAQTVVHILDYIGVDYAEAVEHGKVKNADEYKEMVEFAAQVRTLLGGLPDNPSRAGLQVDAERLAALVDAKAPAEAIAQQASALRWSVIRAYGLQIAPKAAPDIKAGAALYAAQCAACHGAQGRGDGAAGRSLEPAPSNFHDRERMAQRSVYGLYNTITLGVAGTGMAAYAQLGEDQRWALAFLVAGFAVDEEARAKGAALWRAGRGRQEFADLSSIATLSAQEVRQRFGDDATAVWSYLVTEPQAMVAARPAPLDFARATLGRSLDAYRRGAQAEAAQLAIQAYLEGFELVEASLANFDAALMQSTEREMMAYRALVQAGAPLERVEQQAAAVSRLLERASERLASTELSPAATFVSALVILLREGAEAILVVAAILAFLRRAGRSDAARWVHLGWVVALALGGVTWVVSSRFIEISGANREITEGVTALVAAAMLLYVGYWLHSKSHSQAWQKFIGDRVGAALSRGTVWTLALISFLAVYREAFETVLFYQALAAQLGERGGAWMAWGIGAAVVALLAFAWAILRASVRLPIGLFFSASGIVLLLLAVVFTGQGVSALQEAGSIGSDAVSFVSLPLLGIHPTVQSLGAQAVVAVLAVLALWTASRRQRRARAAQPSTLPR
jgi:high-affinity iron transporter